MEQNKSEPKTYSYDADKIALAITLLGSIQVSGIKSCEGVIKINNILASPLKIEGGK